MHPATVQQSVIATESHLKISGRNLGNIFVTERYKSVNAQCVKSVNAQCVSVNAKAIHPGVRNERYWVYEVNGKCVQRQRVKVCAVNTRNILVLNYVFSVRLEVHTLICQRGSCLRNCATDWSMMSISTQRHYSAPGPP